MTYIRIIWQFRLEGTSGGLFSNLLIKAGSALRSDQVAQDVIQPGLENPKDGVCTTFLSNLLHCLGVVTVKSFSFYLVRTSHVSTDAWCLFILPPWTPVRSLIPCSRWPPHRYWGASVRSPMNLFSRLDKFSVSSVSPHRGCTLALEHVGGPLQMSNFKC